VKTARTRLSARYLTALRTHLGGKAANHANRAQSLGRSALAGGLVTLDLAIMHEQAVVALASSYDFAHARNGVLKRAGVFFTQALLPLEQAQQATRETNRQLQQHNETLRRHTAALASGNRRLEREIARRKAGEVTIRQGREHYQALFRESQIMQKKLRLLTRQIISAQEEERKEISRELHDEVVQTLVGINVELAALTKGTSAGLHKLRAKIARTQRLVANSVNAVHRFARELRPAVLDDLGLIPALHVFCKGLAARKKLKIQLTAFRGVEALGGAERTVLFRVAQEALNNVVRHARASAVTISISRMPATVRMEIADNGKSFPVGQTLLPRNNKRLGLVGMRERIEMVGGHLTIKSAPGHGTTVCAEIPFTPENTKK
jgi:two-component system sensor histidine kinase DegS